MMHSDVHFVAQSVANKLIPITRQTSHSTQFKFPLPIRICAISIKATWSTRITHTATQNQGLRMNAPEHILLLQLPSVDYVKYLAENKAIKDNGFANLLADAQDNLPFRLEEHRDGSLI
jgi:hypothetical protein